MATPQRGANGPRQVETIAFASTITPNAAAAPLKRVTVTGAMTIAAPTNPADLLELQFELYNSSAAAVVVTLSSATNGFLFGSDFTALPSIAAGKTLLVGARYNSRKALWLVFSIANGF